MPRRLPNAPYRRRERRLQAFPGVSVANGDRRQLRGREVGQYTH